MRHMLAIAAVLVVALSTPPAVAGLECLNSKPCGHVCIARNKVCHPPAPCPHGAYRCGKTCIPNRDLCGVR